MFKRSNMDQRKSIRDLYLQKMGQVREDPPLPAVQRPPAARRSSYFDRLIDGDDGDEDGGGDDDDVPRKRVNSHSGVYGASLTAKKVRRCGECEGCTRDECGKCRGCRDMPKFGGGGKRNLACALRKCLGVTKRDTKAAASTTEDPLDLPPGGGPKTKVVVVKVDRRRGKKGS